MGPTLTALLRCPTRAPPLTHAWGTVHPLWETEEAHLGEQEAHLVAAHLEAVLQVAAHPVADHLEADHPEVVSKGRQRRRWTFPTEASTTTMATSTALMLGRQQGRMILTNVFSSATTWMEFLCMVCARTQTITT